MPEINYQIRESVYNNELDNWWYRVRRKIVINIALKHSKRDRKIKLLDIGFGTGALAVEINKTVDYYGIDNSPDAVEFASQRGVFNLKVGDASHISFPENTFDLVLALDVLEHVEDDNSAIKEIRRVLKNNGKAIIFVPALKILWGWADIAGKHYRRYSMKTLKFKFLKNNFLILRSSYFNFFLFFPILIARNLARILCLEKKSELVGNKLFNKLLFFIFYFEYLLLKVINFPFGVSIMLIVKKGKS